MGAAEDQERLIRLVYRLGDEDLPDAIEYLEWLIAQYSAGAGAPKPDHRLRDEDSIDEGRKCEIAMQTKVWRLVREAWSLTGDREQALDWFRRKPENDPQRRTLREEIDRFLDGAGRDAGRE